MAVGAQDGEGSAAPADFNVTAIEVDIDSLKDFRAFLGRELDANLRPGAERVTHEHILGAGFGRDIRSHPIQKVRSEYEDQLDTAMRNLAAYVETSEVLIEAIQRVAARYETADLNAESISKALIQAIHDVGTSRAMTVATDLASEVRREQHRALPGQPAPDPADALGPTS